MEAYLLSLSFKIASECMLHNDSEKELIRLCFISRVMKGTGMGLPSLSIGTLGKEEIWLLDMLREMRDGN